MRLLHFGMLFTSLLVFATALPAQPMRVLTAQHGSVNSLAISPNGKYLAAGCSSKEQGAVLLWDLPSGQLLQTWTGYLKFRQRLAFSRDSNYLAISTDESLSGANDSTLEIRNLTNQTLKWKITPQNWDVGQPVFSPDGKLLGCSDGQIRLLDVASGDLRRTLSAGELLPIGSFEFSPDGKVLVAGGYDHSKQAGVVMWFSVQDSKLKQSKVTSETNISVFYPVSSNLIFCGSGGGHINIWDARNKKKARSFRLESEGEMQAVSPDGSWILGPHDIPFVRRETEVGIWDAKTGRLLHVLTGHKQGGPPIALSKDGNILASGGDDWLPDDSNKTTVNLWDIKSLLKPE